MILLMYFYRSYFIYSTSLVEFRSRLQWFKPQNTGLKLFFTKIVFVAGSVDGGIKSLASIIFKNYNYLAERFDKISTWSNNGDTPHPTWIWKSLLKLSLFKALQNTWLGIVFIWFNFFLIQGFKGCGIWSISSS